VPEYNICAAAAGNRTFPHHWLARVLASCTDLPRWFFDPYETLASVNVRPYGVLNRGWDADPVLGLVHVDGARLLAARQFGYWVAEPLLDIRPSE
jgi:hypothetical protein